MDNCANTCSKPDFGILQVSPEMTHAAETLACLLTDLPEFQNYLRMARAVHADNEVNKILAAMNGYGDYEGMEQGAFKDLNKQLESLPVMRAFRQAEQDAHGVFAMVDQVISGAAGVSFAEHARPSACS